MHSALAPRARARPSMRGESHGGREKLLSHDGDSHLGNGHEMRELRLGQP